MARQNAKQTAKIEAQAAEVQIDTQETATTNIETAEHTEEDIASALNKLEAIEAQEVQSDQAEVQSVPAAGETEQKSFRELMNEITDEQALDFSKRIHKALEEREQYEKEKDGDNTNIHRTLKGVRSRLTGNDSARVLMVTKTSTDFINRSVHEGKRHNVYALQKVADMVERLKSDGGAAGNAINGAIVKSLFNLKKVGMSFTFELARACCSQNIRIGEGNHDISEACRPALAHLARHTVAPVTAPTQSSSTMSALQVLGIVTASGGKRSPVFTLTDSPATRRLEEMFTA